MKAVLLTKETGWYGKHSGYYEQLPRRLREIGANVEVFTPENNLVNRGLGKLAAIRLGLPPRNQSITHAEQRFWSAWKNSEKVGHLLTFEDNHWALPLGERAPRRLIATLHYPPEKMSQKAREALPRLSSAIVLYRRDIPIFEEAVGEGRVHFIPHGVDIHFFTPPAVGPRNRLAYVGQFGRNTAMLSRIVPRLLDAEPELEIDIVIASKAFAEGPLSGLQKLARVNWHFGIPDEELLNIYQNSRALLLPMNASGANNAIVEALACGLPILTTDVGGARDYGGGTIYPLAKNDADDELIDLTLQILRSETARMKISQAAREFAVERLAWPKVAAEHLRAYQELSS
ncbi:MAG TPA: glycosyltransferase family 4 protein [Methylomirabilota bacterium]|nr:glycosyltransferase family 4 protein [Methylomirabilota bacterium]